MKHLLLILFLFPVVIFGQRLKIGKQLEKAPGINYMVLTDINGEQYYTPMSTVLGGINTDRSLGTVTLSGNNLIVTERDVLTNAITATYTINLAPYMQTLTAVDNGNGTVTLNLTGDASPELIDICNIVSTHCNSDLTVSPTGLVTFTDNAGNSMTFNLISPVAGNDISYNNGLYLSETVTALSYNPTTHSLSYVNEAGATNTITLDVAGLTFNAGTNTITYTAENGVVTNIVLPADVVTTITNTINGNRIATYTNENGVAVDIEETITTIVNNGDGTYTYTNETGATATFPAQVNTDTRLSLSVVNDSLRVDVVNIVTGATVSTSYIDNVINQADVLTTLAYNSTTHTLTYTDENGVATNLPLDVATMTYNATTNTITYTAEDGTVTNIALPVETVTTVTNTIAGNRIATYTNENAVAVDINETITSSSFNAATNELTITNESGLPVTYQLNSDSTVVNGGDNITVTQVSPNVYEIDFIYNCDSIAACIPADIDTIVSGFAIVNDVATITLSSGQTYSATITHPADSTVVQTSNSNLTVTEVTPNVYDVSFLYNCDSIQNCLTPLGILQEPLVVAGDTTGYITNILDPVTGVTVRDTIFFPAFNPLDETTCTTFDEKILVEKLDGTIVTRPANSIKRNEVYPAGNYTVLPTDEIIYAVGGSTITLPDCTTCKEKTIYRDACSDGLITILPPSGQTIDGVHTSRTLQVGRGAFTYECVGGEWRIKSEFFEQDQSCASFSVLNTPSAAVTVFTLDGLPYSVDWGDGSNSGLIASGVQTSKAYGSNFTGDIKICKTCGVAPIYRVIFNNGNWDFDIIDLNQFPNLTNVQINTGITSGDIANLPSGLTVYFNYGQNTTTGDIANLPSGLTYYLNDGQNTTSGDIANLPSGLTYYSNDGQNTTTGDIANLPSGLTYYSNYGQNTTTGDIANLPIGLTNYSNSGQNTTSGDISNLPSGLTTYSNGGQNTTSGDIANLPSGLTYYYNQGQNTTSGDIANLPSGLTTYSNSGQNTTSGDISNLPSGLTTYNNRGQNTTTGDIANLPSGLTTYSNSGQNTTSGDIANLPSGLTSYTNEGQNTVSDYSGGNLNSGITYFDSYSLNATFNSTEVDDLLIELATTLPGLSYVRITGGAAAPTAASLAARNAIIASGATLITN